MPSLSSEVLGVIAVVVALLLLALVVDPTIRARRKANRAARRDRRIRRHAAAGCQLCRVELEVAAQRAELDALEALIADEEARR